LDDDARFYFIGTEFCFKTLDGAKQYLASVPLNYRRLITSVTFDICEQFRQDLDHDVVLFRDATTKRLISFRELGLSAAYSVYATMEGRGNFFIENPHIECVIFEYRERNYALWLKLRLSGATAYRTKTDLIVKLRTIVNDCAAHTTIIGPDERADKSAPIFRIDPQLCA